MRIGQALQSQISTHFGWSIAFGTKYWINSSSNQATQMVGDGRCNFEAKGGGVRIKNDLMNDDYRHKKILKTNDPFIVSLG